jgi:probable phosphoglycerate mutase
MKRKVEFYVARHGQNEDNVKGILNGHRDLPLTDLGRIQARQLAEGIIAEGLSFDAIYCSPLSRAHETAEIVASMLGVAQKPIVIDELIERDFGIMSGQPATKIAEMCAPDIIVTDTIRTS